MLRGELVDRWRLWRGDKLVFAETVRLDGQIAEKLTTAAVANGGAAIGTALIVPGDEALVEFTARFDGAQLSTEQLVVTQAELMAASLKAVPML